MPVKCGFCGNKWPRYWNKDFECMACGAVSSDGKEWKRVFNGAYPSWTFEGCGRELIDVITHRTGEQSRYLLSSANELFSAPEKIPSYMLFYCSACGEYKHLKRLLKEWKNSKSVGTALTKHMTNSQTLPYPCLVDRIAYA